MLEAFRLSSEGIGFDKNDLSMDGGDDMVLPMRQTLITNGLLVDAEGSKYADVFIEGSLIKKVAPKIDAADYPEAQIIDADGLCVLPGLIDAHTHYHLVSRGTVTADSFSEGSQLAAFGGVTTVIDFADHDKTHTLLESSKKRIDAMKQGMAIDFALHQGVYGMHDSIDQELEELAHAGITTIKIFTTYKNVGYLIEMEGLHKLFAACKKHRIMVSAHCEDDDLIESINQAHTGTHTPADHATLRPAEAEYRAIKHLGALAKEYSMPLYIVHLSSAQGLAAVRELRSLGVEVTVETVPHYLFLDSSRLNGPLGPLFVMTPPLRTEHDNQVLQEALKAHEVQVVATDHCSFTREQKLASDDCRTIFPGIPGTEELFPLMHTFALGSGKLDLSDVVTLLSTNPAKCFGLYPQKGSLCEGSDADIILVDPKHEWTITADSVHTQAHYSPYEDFNVVGKVIQTILRGNTIMNRGVYHGESGSGKFLKASVPGVYIE